MIGKTTRLLMVSGMVMVLVGAAQGGTVIDVVDQILQDMDPDPDPPMHQINGVIFEDDDWTMFVDAAGHPISKAPGVGDRIIGIFDLPQLYKGQPTKSRVAPLIGKIDTAYVLADEGRELTGAFELEVTSIDGTGIHFGSVAVASRVFLSSLTPGTVYELFEDTAQNFSAQGVSLAVDAATAQDGVLWAELGFTGSGTEFYDVVPTGPGKEDITFSLNWTVAPPDWAPASPWSVDKAVITYNNFGTEAYGSGSLDIAGTTGTIYNRTSDVDTVVLYAPVPAAMPAGMVLFAGMAGVAAIRRRLRA
jgi:hypothetical protein